MERALLPGGWQSIKNELSSLPGATLSNDIPGRAMKQLKRSLILVFFIGGVTYGEITALRWISKKYNKEIIIATTNITTGNHLLSQTMISNSDTVKNGKTERTFYKLN